jgi:hypothetical protein
LKSAVPAAKKGDGNSSFAIIQQESALKLAPARPHRCSRDRSHRETLGELIPAIVAEVQSNVAFPLNICLNKERLSEFQRSAIRRQVSAATRKTASTSLRLVGVLDPQRTSTRRPWRLVAQCGAPAFSRASRRNLVRKAG